MFPTNDSRDGGSSGIYNSRLRLGMPGMYKLRGNYYSKNRTVRPPPPPDLVS